MSSPRDMENRFLGALLGLAIGDALGMPVADEPVEATRARLGEIRGYHPRSPGGEGEIPAGEITEETETVLCIVESMTANNGQLEPEIINARLMHLVDGPSRHWMPEAMREGIRRAWEGDGLVPESGDRGGTLAVAVRGVPIGLMHAVGGFDRDIFVAETRAVARLSDGGAGQAQLALDVATGVLRLLRPDGVEMPRIDGDLSGVTDEREAIARIAALVDEAETFEEPVFEVVNTLRPADSAGAIAGTLAGARFGASGIPQDLIDGLEARVYLSLAAPWFYRTAARRAGTLIDLRPI